MKNRISILAAMLRITIALVAVIGLAMTACDDGLDKSKKAPDLTDDGFDGDPVDGRGGSTVDTSSLSSYTITYAAKGNEVSRLLGWQWGIQSPAGYDFKWIFNNDGTISVVHCCGFTAGQQGAYLLCGNVLATYSGGSSINVGTFTMADNNASFDWDGTNQPRRDPDANYSAGSSFVLSNTLLGTWQGEDGTEYTFSADAGLRINAEEYGYLVWEKTGEILTLGPLVDGEKAGLCLYKFRRNGNKLQLRPSGGTIVTLSPAE